MQIPWQKIQALEEEIKALKSLGEKPKKKISKKKAKPLDIEGMLKGVKFSEKDIEDAQKAIFDFKEIK